jgi:NAD+ synthase (glutamine-hydrolysing)
VDLEQDAETIAREHRLDLAIVKRWMRMLDITEYKRAQAALVLKISDRAFGPGRRYPLAARP